MVSVPPPIVPFEEPPSPMCSGETLLREEVVDLTISECDILLMLLRHEVEKSASQGYQLECLVYQVGI